MSTKNILWADDEIDLLKSHIIFLQNKGYNVIAVNSGEDAIEKCKTSRIDLLFLDEMMTGLDGISTLKIIKKDNPNLPVVMVTKNEEEWLMEEAIAEQITNYLIKPVNPNQILMACKNIFENKKISDDKNIKDFLSYYNSLIDLDYNALDYSNWADIYNDLCEWFIRLENMDNNDFIDMLNEQKIILNSQFSNFFKSNYLSWINRNSYKPTMSFDVFDHSIKSYVEDDKKVVFIIIDCLRADQWKKISPLVEDRFDVNQNYHYSILPSATPFARNSIFSGLLPLEIKNEYPDIWKKMFINHEFNKHEDVLFEKLLQKNSFLNKKSSYIKVSDFKSGKKILNKISDYKNSDILNIVVNFVDILGHSRSESQILEELIPNEAAYRQSIYNWFNNSWLNDCLSEFYNWGRDVIITSDHGNILVNKPVAVKADNTVSTGTRYKYGRNLNIKSKNVLKISNPESYMLPKFDVNTEYLIAEDRSFFVYHNQYHKYINMYKNSFQHGGVSLDEIIVPLVKLKNKKND